MPTTNNDPLDYSAYSYSELMLLYEALLKGLDGSRNSYVVALFRREVAVITKELSRKIESSWQDQEGARQ